MHERKGSDRAVTDGDAVRQEVGIYRPKLEDRFGKIRRPTSQCLRDVLHGGPGLVPQQGVEGHHHPGRAEAALGAVTLGYSLLHTRTLEVLQRGLVLAPTLLLLLLLLGGLTCTGWILVLVLPMPSTVVTAAP